MKLLRGHFRAADLPADEPKLLVIAALSTTLMAAIGARLWLPAEALVPAVATALLALAAIAALAAGLNRRNRNARAAWLDLAGIFTLIGVLASVMLEPEHAAHFVEATTRGR